MVSPDPPRTPSYSPYSPQAVESSSRKTSSSKSKPYSSSDPDNTSMTPSKAVSKALEAVSLNENRSKTRADCGWSAYTNTEAKASNAPIEQCLELPPCLAPRPERRVEVCLQCISGYGNATKNVLDPSNECGCSGGGNCDRCTHMTKQSCTRLPLEFNRAINILDYLRKQCLKTSGDAAKQLERLERFRTYASSLHKAYFELEAKAAREFGDKGKGVRARVKDKEDLWQQWRVARRTSAEANMKRFEKGHGTSGTQEPANVVTDEDVEQAVLRALTCNAERRVVYYGFGAR